MDSDAQEEDRDIEPTIDPNREQGQDADAGRPSPIEPDDRVDDEIAGGSGARERFVGNLPPAENESVAAVDSIDQRGFGALEPEHVDSLAASAGSLIEPEALAARPGDADEIQPAQESSSAHAGPEAPIDAAPNQPALVDMSQTGADEALAELPLSDPLPDQDDKVATDEQAADALAPEPADVVESGRAVIPRDDGLGASETSGLPVASEAFQASAGSDTTDMREPPPVDMADDARESATGDFSVATHKGPGDSSFAYHWPTTMPGETAGEFQPFRMPPLLLEVERADWELRIEKLLDQAAKRMDQIAKDRIDAELSYRDHVYAAQMRALYR